MFYIFNKEGQCIATCSSAPNCDDLACRKERTVEAEQIYDDITLIRLVGEKVTQLEPRVALMTFKEKEKHYVSVVQNYMDSKARERRYDDIKTAITYENSSDPIFKAEAIVFREWRDKLWRTCYTILDKVKKGTRSEPATSEALIAELPALKW